MSFAETETSQDEGSPVSLYLFRYGEGVNDVYAYTDHEKDIERNDGNIINPVWRTYVAIPIDHSEIRASGKLEDADLTVTADRKADLAALFKHYPPSSIVTLIIRQGHLDDPDAQFIVAWSGRVLSFQFLGDQAEFICKPISTSLKQVMIRRHYQLGCPHSLYGPACRADREEFTVDSVVVAVNGSVIELPPNWETNLLKPNYKGGIAAWTMSDGRTVERTIIDALENGQVILAGPALGMEIGEVISMSRGCLHIMDDCYNFDNILNYGGQPWIPLQNPIGLTNNFY